MPRLTNAQYLYQRNRLRVSWQRRKGAPFVSLSANDQLYLYAYFAPTKEATREEAIAHRKAISDHFPSLPQQAGRAYKRVFAYLDPERSGPVLPEKRIRKVRGKVVVRAERHHKPDAQKVTRALLYLVETDLKKPHESPADPQTGTRPSLK